MKSQCELISEKTIVIQDSMDKSLAALQSMATQSMCFDDEEGNLYDSELQVGQSLNVSQVTMDFERLPIIDKGAANTTETQTAIKS